MYIVIVCSPVNDAIIYVSFLVKPLSYMRKSQNKRAFKVKERKELSRLNKNILFHQQGFQFPKIVSDLKANFVRVRTFKIKEKG